MNSPSQWVEPELDEARRARQWAGIEPRLVGHRKWPLAAAVSLALALIIAVVVWMPSESQIVAEAVAVQTSTQEGSRILVQPGARLRIVRDEATQVSVVLEQGTARFKVSQRKARLFEVSAGDLKVVVVGTTFDVSVDEDGAGRVSVSEGIVSAMAGGKTYRVVAGASYPPQVEVEADDVTEPENDPVDPTAIAEPEPDTKADTQKRAKSTRPRRVRPTSKAPSKAKPAPTAAQLFELALVSRRAGRNEQAERTLSELVRLYPTDQRAGLAAFQLGRLRMDALHNRTGATQAFERALELQPEAVFAEDATARLVELYRRRGFKTRCEAMRQRYLSRYPEGAHLVQVSSSCGGP